MKIVLFLVFVILNYVMLFIVIPKISPNKSLKTLGIILGCLILCAMILSAFLKPINDINSNIIFMLYVSIIIIIGINIANLLSHMLVNYIIYFHEKFNTANIDKNPIKFLIEKRENIKKAFTIIWFILATVILAGNWFGK